MHVVDKNILTFLHNYMFYSSHSSCFKFIDNRFQSLAAGATTKNVPDAVHNTTPAEFRSLNRYLW